MIPPGLSIPWPLDPDLAHVQRPLAASGAVDVECVTQFAKFLSSTPRVGSSTTYTQYDTSFCDCAREISALGVVGVASSTREVGGG